MLLVTIVTLFTTLVIKSHDLLSVPYSEHAQELFDVQPSPRSLCRDDLP